MLNDRNQTVHIYDGNAAERLAEKILTKYIPEFQSLRDNLIKNYTEKFLREI